MYHFKFYAPTKVVFGRNTEEQLTDLVREFGGKKLLIHYGGGSVIHSGLLQKVKDQLDSSGISYVSLGGYGAQMRGWRRRLNWFCQKAEREGYAGHLSGEQVN